MHVRMYVCVCIYHNRLELQVQGSGNPTQLRLLKEGEEQSATSHRLRRH